MKDNKKWINKDGVKIEILNSKKSIKSIHFFYLFNKDMERIMYNNIDKVIYFLKNKYPILLTSMKNNNSALSISKMSEYFVSKIMNITYLLEFLFCMLLFFTFAVPVLSHLIKIYILHISSVLVLNRCMVIFCLILILFFLYRYLKIFTKNIL